MKDTDKHIWLSFFAKWQLVAVNCFCKKKSKMQNCVLDVWHAPLPTNIYLFKFNNKITRKRCEICSELTIKTPKRRQWRRSGVFIVNLNIFHAFFSVSIINVEQENINWDCWTHSTSYCNVLTAHVFMLVEFAWRWVIWYIVNYQFTRRYRLIADIPYKWHEISFCRKL